LAALQVLSDIIAHHQEHLNCNYSFLFHSHVVVGCCRGTTHVNETRSCNYSYNAPDDKR